MESKTTNLSEWEAKERAGLLSLEMEEWCEKRRVAEDPNTTADVLEQFAEAVCQELDVWQPGEPMGNADNVQVNTLLLTEPIVAHPNTSPHVLKRLLERVFNRELGERSLITKAVCRNPVLPFLTLEAPDFWMNLDGDVCKALLREEALPPLIVRILLGHKGSRVNINHSGVETPLKDHSVAEAARLHISQAPPLQTALDGCKALTTFWKDYCTQQRQDPDYVFERDDANEWHAEMVEVGLAPAWMPPLYNSVPPVSPAIPKHIEDWYTKHPEYAYLLRPDIDSDDLMHIAQTRLEDNYEGVSLLLLHHPRVTVEIIRFITEKQPQSEVRIHIAAHLLTPPDVLIQMVDVPLQRSWVEDSARYEALRAENARIRRLACHHTNAPSDLTDYARRAFLEATKPMWPIMGLPDTGLPLVDFVTALRGVRAGEIRTYNIEPTDWVNFLIAALNVPINDVPLDYLGRSPLDFLYHLGRDGNRFVRWAAQTRLAYPDFVFTWAEEE